MPITEQEAADALKLLPSDSFLFRYAIHGAKNTSSPLVYHIGVGISLLAVTCPLSYGIHYAGALRANNYVLLVGRSGDDQKSTALNNGRVLLDQAAPALIGDNPGSPEGLIDSLAQAPSQLIPISEFGKFLSSAQRGYFEPTKTLLADVWDSHPIQRVRANNRTVRVEEPRLSIAAACSIPYLEKHTLAEDWTGGFMGRWFVLYGQRERTIARPTGDMSGVPWLVNVLQSRVNLGQAGFCLGFDNQSGSMWDTWYNDIYNRRLPSNVMGIQARAPTIALKIALALGWDYGPATVARPWKITPNILKPAIAIAELHVKSLIHLSDMIAEHDDARMRRSVLRAIDDRGGAATLGELCGSLQRKKRPIVETLDSLVEEGRVKFVQTALGATYVRVY